MTKPLLAVNVRLYNNRLRSLRLRHGFTAAELSRRVPMQQTAYSLLERMKVSPKTEKGKWRSYVTRLATYWKTTEDDLFPAKLLRMHGYEIEFEAHPNEVRDIGLGLSQYSREMYIPESNVMRKELCERLESLINSTLLNETENRIFRMRFFEGLNLEEIGSRIGWHQLDVEAELIEALDKMRANFIRIERPNDSFIVNLERIQ
jgi:transcriptional regulator with XRE-family HTH domain